MWTMPTWESLAFVAIVALMVAAKQLLPASVAAGLRVAPPLREHLAADDAGDGRVLDALAGQLVLELAPVVALIAASQRLAAGHPAKPVQIHRSRADFAWSLVGFGQPAGVDALVLGAVATQAQRHRLTVAPLPDHRLAWLEATLAARAVGARFPLCP